MSTDLVAYAESAIETVSDGSGDMDFESIVKKVAGGVSDLMQSDTLHSVLGEYSGYAESILSAVQSVAGSCFQDFGSVVQSVAHEIASCENAKSCDIDPPHPLLYEVFKNPSSHVVAQASDFTGMDLSAHHLQVAAEMVARNTAEVTRILTDSGVNHSSPEYQRKLKAAILALQAATAEQQRIAAERKKADVQAELAADRQGTCSYCGRGPSRYVTRRDQIDVYRFDR